MRDRFLTLLTAVSLLAACTTADEQSPVVDLTMDLPQEVADQSTLSSDLDIQVEEDLLLVEVAEEVTVDVLQPEVWSEIASDVAVDPSDVVFDVVEDSESVDTAPELEPVCGLAEPCDDGDPCTVDDQCDDEGGCAGEVMDCDDEEPCTDGDSCVDGECVAGDFICDCLADEDCAELEDGDFCNGTFFCDDSEFPYECAIDPESISTCVLQEPDSCNVWGCAPESGECILIPVAEGVICNDEDPCTEGDVCSAGVCAGVLKPLMCAAGTTYCVGDSVCLCDACGNGCEQVVKVCTAPAYYCVNGNCMACQPYCKDGQCGDDGCGGSCGTCPGTSTCNLDGECVCDCPAGGEPVCNPLTGVTYASVCAAACSGVEETQPGTCGAACYTVEDAVPAEAGLPVADFFCKDANMNSPGLGGPISNVTLKETIWIAYFGACT